MLGGYACCLKRAIFFCNVASSTYSHWKKHIFLSNKLDIVYCRWELLQDSMNNGLGDLSSDIEYTRQTHLIPIQKGISSTQFL